MTASSARLPVHLALLTVSLIYGFFYITLKLLLTELSQGEVILLRLVLTASLVILWEWGVIRTRIETALDGLQMGLLGLLGVLCVQGLLVVGVHKTTAFHAALLMATIPLMTLLFSTLMGRDRMRPGKLLGTLMGFAGVALLILLRTPDSPLPETAWLGDVLVLLNAAGFSWYLIGNQSLMRKYPAFSVMAYQYLISALVALLIFRQETFSLLEKIPALPNDILCLIAYTVFFASIATYTLNNYALKRTTPATVALYIFIQPVLSAVLGHFILHEPFTETMALAGALTLTGVFLATRPVRQTEADLNPLPQE